MEILLSPCRNIATSTTGTIILRYSLSICKKVQNDQFSKRIYEILCKNIYKNCVLMHHGFEIRDGLLSTDLTRDLTFKVGYCL